MNVTKPDKKQATYLAEIKIKILTTLKKVIFLIPT